MDFSKILAEIERFTTLEAGIEALFAAKDQAKSEAVAKAIADTMATDAATAEQVKAAAQAALDDVDAKFAAQNDKLSAAIVTNTPAAPPTA